MLRGKKLIAIIPVRKNSKGIKKKNLLKINGKTLLDRTIEIAKKNKFVDQTIVSTDCRQMFNISKKYGVNDNCLRPKKLSGGRALTTDLVKYIIKKYDLKKSYILLLQVTSPFRNQKLLNSFLKHFKNKKFFNSSVSISQFDSPHPYKIQIIKNKILYSFLNKESMVPRQSLPKVYKLSGMFYLCDTEQIVKNKSFFKHPVLPFIIKNEFSLNLDTYEDLVILKDKLKSKSFLSKISK
tara:strand:+ start:758 stop:1471 length:714 start_codon:yes stop_codon:yes gene_type:complete